jgi:allophanate hydrolase subunit 2
VSGLSRTIGTLRVLPGPQRDRFAADALDVLQSAPYRVNAESNRVGYRLSGPKLQHMSEADIISDATPMGSIQVPSSGEPILLMADRQTTGGYAKIATVISADIPVAGQLAPGDEIRFVVCSPADAVAALKAQEDMLLAVERT